MNSKGQIIITDLIFYLIIITVILSIVIYSFAMINDNQVENIEISNINQVLEDVTGTLMTQGIPYNWYETGTVEQIGLTVNNNSNRISYQKVMKLKENPELLNDYFPDGIRYSIYLEPLNKSNENITIVDTNLGKNIYQKTRNVVMDYGYESLLISNENSCPLNHTNNYSCNFININKTNLNEGKYYLVSGNSTTYLLSNTYNEIINSSDTELNTNLNNLVHDDSDTIYIHLAHKNDTYIVYDKFNQKDNLYSVINPDIYTLHIVLST